MAAGRQCDETSQSTGGEKRIKKRDEKTIIVLLLLTAALFAGCSNGKETTSNSAANTTISIVESGSPSTKDSTPQETEQEDPLEQAYLEAVSLYHNHKYKEAKDAFALLLEYKNSREYYDSIVVKARKSSVKTVFKETKKTETWIEKEIMTFDSEGYLTSLKDKWGETTEFLYNTSEKRYLSAIRNGNGNVETFDKDGNLIMENRISNGKSYMYEYNKSGEPVRYIESDSSKTNIYMIVVYKYDARGNLLETRRTSSTPNYVESYTYDTSDRLTIYEAKYAPPDNNPIRKKEYEYNNEGLLSKESVWKDEVFWGQSYHYLSEITEYAYDENGNETMKRNYDPNGQWWYQTEQVYNENGNVITEIRTDSKGNRDVFEWEYDKNGNETKHISYGKLSREREYDNQGNCVKGIDYDLDGRPYAIWENDYDDQGNIIKTTYNDETQEYTYNKYGVIEREVYENSEYIQTKEYSDFVFYIFPKDVHSSGL